MGNIDRPAYAETVARPSPRLRSGQVWPCVHGLEARATGYPTAIYVKLLLTTLVISSVYLTNRTHKTKAA